MDFKSIINYGLQRSETWVWMQILSLNVFSTLGWLTLYKPQFFYCYVGLIITTVLYLGIMEINE